MHQQLKQHTQENLQKIQEKQTASGTTREGEIIEMLEKRNFIQNIKAYERSEKTDSSIKKIVNEAEKRE